MNTEIWKDIEGYEGLYKINESGKIISSPKKGNGYRRVVLSPFKNDDGYLIVGLYKDKKSRLFFLHRLLASTFIPNPENKPEVDHINAVRNDNRISNLRWVTHKENVNNPASKINYVGRNILNNKRSKIVNQYDLSGEFIKSHTSIRSAERETGIGNGNISNCCTGRSKSAGGYVWKFA